MRPLPFSIKSERVKNVKPKRSGKNIMFLVRVYIDAFDKYDLHDVRYVIYELHPSFQKPKVISNNLNSNFDIEIWTWGFFDINAQVVMKEGYVQNVSGYVKYYVQDAVDMIEEEKKKGKEAPKSTGPKKKKKPGK